MSNWTFSTMIVPAALATEARDIALALSPVGGAGMFRTGLSESGLGPATHYVSTGPINPMFSSLITNAGNLHDACQSVGIDVSPETCEALVSDSDVSADDPFVAFARLGLQIIAEEETP